jgi:dTMP kinase
MAFQSAKLPDENEKKVFLEWLEELEFGIYHIPKPDMIIYLYLPFKKSQEMVDKKSKRKYTELTRDIHESNDGYLAQVEKEYLKLADDNPEWKIIDCSAPDGILTIPEITEKIVNTIASEVSGTNHRNQLKFNV